MSLHSTITAAPVWPADLLAAGVVSNAGHVYTGRRRQKVSNQTEVWLEQLPSEGGGPGLQGVTRFPYLVHVMRRGNMGARGTGERNLTEVEAHAHTIRERYQDECPFLADVPEMIHAEAQVEEVDDDPEDERQQTATIRVTFTVAG